MKRKLENLKKLIISGMREYSSLPVQQEEEKLDIMDLTSIEKIKSIYGIASSIDIETLKLIERALDKIESGRYGVCELCGVQIDKERLEEIPYVKYCIDCQQKVEFEERSSRLFLNKYEVGYVSPESAVMGESEEEMEVEEEEEEKEENEIDEEGFEKYEGRSEESEEVEEIEEVEEGDLDIDQPIPEEITEKIEEEIEKEILEEGKGDISVEEEYEGESGLRPRARKTREKRVSKKQKDSRIKKKQDKKLVKTKKPGRQKISGAEQKKEKTLKTQRTKKSKK